MPFKVRRFVTGFNDKGHSNVTYDGIATNLMELSGWPGLFVTDLWVTDESPADNSVAGDRGARPITHDPKPCGSLFRIVEIPPERNLRDKIDTGATFAALGSHRVPTQEDSGRHPSMHATDSIDYLVVISGEMHMLMEDGEVLLQQGDCIVQRGTKHAWINRSDAPCVIAAVLIDAKPWTGSPT
jgi:mannose-6-phosphate isomerase-like protein (cupin superfamily)